MPSFLHLHCSFHIQDPNPTHLLNPVQISSLPHEVSSTLFQSKHFDSHSTLFCTSYYIDLLYFILLYYVNMFVVLIRLYLLGGQRLSLDTTGFSIAPRFPKRWVHGCTLRKIFTDSGFKFFLKALAQFVFSSRLSLIYGCFSWMAYKLEAEIIRKEIINNALLHLAATAGITNMSVLTSQMKYTNTTCRRTYFNTSGEC